MFPPYKPKDLVPIPWMVAMALQSAGWYLRSDVIWAKPSPMPESVTDRPTKAHEYVFLLAKRASYYYDAEAVKEVGSGQIQGGLRHKYTENGPNEFNRTKMGLRDLVGREWTGRNRRSVWTIASEPYPEAHFATFPPALVEPMILAGTSAKGVCPACGEPWRRVVEKVFKGDGNPNGYDERLTKGNLMKLSGAQLAAWKKANPDQVKDWQPSCTCPPADPVPALVLDPFAGSGTTLAVAVKLKRRALGIELNPEYARLAENRLAEPLGIGGLFPPTEPVVVGLFD